MKRQTTMDDPVYSYFHENLATVSKEKLLEALETALKSARCWRDACLLGFPSQTRSEREVGADASRFHGHNKGAQVSAKA
jgi:hypothetical protein